MTQAELEEKVKKLLALSSSPNSHEAALAYEKAQALIDQYNLELKEKALYVRTEYKCPIYIDKGLAERLHFLCGLICPIFGSFCVLETISGKYTFVGTELSNKISTYAMDSLLNNASITFRREFSKNRSISFPFAFWEGFYQGLALNFQEKFMEGCEKYRAVYEWLQKNYHLVTDSTAITSSINGVAAAIGLQEGRTAELRSGAGVSQQTELLN